MVLGICRHVLNQVQDAEDAFQATFLVLARKGASIRDRRVLSGWLHEVAYRIAIKLCPARSVARCSKDKGWPWYCRRMNRTTKTSMRPGTSCGRSCMKRSIGYRRSTGFPVILSYLEGKTNEEVAELLHWPVGTVKGRLSRARDLLRSRLTQADWPSRRPSC